ncbi:MAG: mechanosensitive ion channel [Fuerstiella sp.]|nr:mechanosensitive ion channel [Fuerstiella sp.]
MLRPARHAAVVLAAAMGCSLAGAHMQPPTAQTNDATAKEGSGANQVDSTDSSAEQSVDDLVEEFQDEIEVLSGKLFDATNKDSVAPLLEQSSANVGELRKLLQSTAEIKAITSGLTAEAEGFKTPVVPFDSSGDFRMTESDIDSRILKLTNDLTEEKQQLGDLRTAAKDHLTRKQEKKGNSELQKRNLKAFEASPRTERGNPETLLQDADDLEFRTELAVAKAKLQMSDAELTNLITEETWHLPTTRVEHRKKQIIKYETRLRELKELSENVREGRIRELRSKGEDLQAIIEQAIIDGLDSSGVLMSLHSPKTIADTNISVLREITVREKELEDLTAANVQLEDEAETIQQRIKEFGAEGVIGRDLLHLYDDATPRADIVTQMTLIEKKLSERRAEQLEYAGKLEDVEEIDVPDDERERIDVINGQTELLKSLGKDLRTLSSLLSDLDSEHRRRLALMNEWEDYSSEQSLWFRSHPMLTLSDLASLPAEFSSAAREARAGLKNTLSNIGGSFLVILIPAGLVIALLFAIQHRAKLGVDSVAELAGRRACTTFRPTARAMLLTFGLAAEWPLLMLVTGTLLQTQAAGQTIPHFGLALSELGIILLWLNCFRQALRPDGLAVVHFGWNNTICQILRQWFHGTIIVTLLPMFLFLAVRQGESDGDLIERSLFIVLMIVVGAQVMRLLLPPSNLLVSRLSASFSILATTRWIWTFGPVALVALVIFLSVTGFHYTAVQLAIRCGYTLIVMSLLLLGHQLLTRWLRLHRTKTRLLAARARAMERSKSASDEAEAANSSIPPVEEDTEDVEVFGLQADALLRNIACLTALACMWGIWLDVLPALRVLDREPLWSVYEEVVVPTESGEETTVQTRMERRDVTVGSLLLAVFTLTITVVGVRQIPGLIEVVLRSESNMDAGVRYAICTVTRYVVLLLGMAMIFRLVGLRWSQVQWLVAGLSVGLGFGMQEIFANFVCGLIILVERPIRIGDIVTIDGVSGVVSKIRIRATSITDWDRREYIVPNREFITGKLLNWTLSDTTNRVMVNVGVAYGTDTNRAREVMLDVARNHPDVMSDPGPITTFENFGDSSLDLVLRAYLPNLDNRLGTTTELFTQINLRFAEEGISIPFPQRDVHMQADSSITQAG